MHEHIAASVGSQAMFQVLPVPERVHSLVGTHLLKDVAGRLPGHLLQVKELWHKPLPQHVPQMLAHLKQLLVR